MLLEHGGRNARELGFQFIGIDNRAASKIARAPAYGSQALAYQTTGAGFGHGHGRILHLQVVTGNLLKRITIVGKNQIAQLLFQFGRQLIHALLRLVSRGCLCAQVQLDLPFSREDRGLHIAVALVDGRRPSIALRFRH